METNSYQMENALLGAIMRDGSCYERAREIVKSGDFFWGCYSWAWDACEKLYSQGMGIDTITVGDELEREGKLKDFCLHGSKQFFGRVALAEVRQNGEPKNFLSYAEKVKDYSAKRTISQFSFKMNNWAVNGRKAKDIIADMTTEFSKITIYGAEDEYTVPIKTAVSESYDWTDKAANGEIMGVPTGFYDLDKVLGSLIAGNVYIVAARPGQGKTGLLLTIARHVAKTQKKRVGIFSLEMSRMQVAQRLISQESEIPLKSIIHGTLKENEWAVYTNAVEIVADYPIVINDLSSININQIRQTARKIHATGGLDLIIVDYIQLAGSEEKKQTRELEVSEVSRGLKYLARELNVPILAAAQLSRAVEQRADKRPVLSDLRESGSLEQDAYAVMFIYRPDQYEVNTDKHYTAEIITAKHRNGETGSVELIIRSPIVKFENASVKVFRPNE